MERSSTNRTCLVALLVLGIAQQAAADPKDFLLHFHLDFAKIDNDPDQIDEVRVAFKLPRPPPHGPRYVSESPEGGAFSIQTRLPGTGSRLQGYLSRRVKGPSNLAPTSATRTQFCLTQEQSYNGTEIASAAVNCAEGELCAHEREDKEKLFGICSNWRASRLTSTGMVLVSHHEQSPIWITPSLETMASEPGFSAVGYTAFAIAVNLPSELEADSYTYSVRANDHQVYIDGLAPEDLVYPLDPSAPFVLRFGLENLDFAGVDSGCDRIVVLLNLFSGEKLARSYELRRSYAALRAAPEINEVLDDGTTINWTGVYRKTVEFNEWEVFALSGRNRYIKAEFGEDPSPRDRARIEKLKEAMNGDKKRFDRLGLMYEGKHVIGVIRPPLRQWTFGLVVALESPKTHQLRFTFPEGAALELRDWLAKQRLEREDVKKVLINPLNNLYEIKGELGALPPDVCEPLLSGRAATGRET
jgi:hypothetical protein